MVILLSAVCNSDFPWAPARFHRILSCQKNEAIGLCNPILNPISGFAIWLIRHFGILPINVKIHTGLF